MPGTPNTTKKATAEAAEDLTLLLSPPPLEPKAVTFLGQKFTLRRDLTGAEVVRFWSLWTSLDILGAFTIMFGTEESAALFKTLVDPLPMDKINPIMDRLWRAAGLLDRKTGESPAS